MTPHTPAPTIFFSAGEASGDRYAAELAARLANPNLTITGIGGPRLARYAQDLHSSADWGAVGLLESLKIVPKALKGYNWAAQKLAQTPPGLFVPIDYGYLNIRLARKAKELGWKVLYVVPPGSWRKTKQGADLPAVTDQIVTPFPWSAEILNQMGAKAHFFGHPLKQMVAETPGPDKEPIGVAVLPGSRLQEIQNNLPTIAQAIDRLPAETTITFAVASNLDPQKLRQAWQKLSSRPAEFESDTYAVLKSARAAVVCSGTATLEAALCACPCVVMYRASKTTYLEFLIRKPKFDYIALPNILLDRLVVPEFIQHDATPVRIADELALLLADSPQRQIQIEAFQQLEATLGPPDALDQTAALARQMFEAIPVPGP